MQNKQSKAKSQNLPRPRVKGKGKKKVSKPSSRRVPRTGAILAPLAKNPMRSQKMRTRTDGAVCRIKGTDFLTSVNTGASGLSAGAVLVSQVVNPSQLGVARLATMSRLYERYKFRSLKFRYAPIANATVSGQLIGYVDYDTYDDPITSGGQQNLQRAAAHYGEKPVQVWQGSESPVFWEIKDVDPMTDLYVDSDGTDNRWTNQGRFVLLAASDLNSNLACGNIYLDYDIEFFIPQLEMTPNTGFGDGFDGKTAMTAALPFGTAPSGRGWNNLPITVTANTNTIVSIPAGTYLSCWRLKGTVISALSVTPTSGTEVSQLGYLVAADAKTLTQTYIHTASVPFTLTVSATATTITEAILYVALLPTNAITVSLRKLTQISRLLKLAGDVKTLKESFDALQSSGVKETKEEKEAKASDVCDATAIKRSPEMVFVPSQSTSSVSPASAGSLSSGSWFHV
jgi:hypothetical protein